MLCVVSSRSRDLRQRTSASDVISDVIQLTDSNCERTPITSTTSVVNARQNDVTHYRRQSSAAVRRRMVTSSSSSSSPSDVSRKRYRYVYNKLQQRLLCDAFAKRKSLELLSLLLL